VGAGGGGRGLVNAAMNFRTQLFAENFLPS